MIIDVRTRVWTGRDPLATASPAAAPTRHGAGQPFQHDPSDAGHARAMELVSASFITGWRADRLGAHLAAEHVAAAVNAAPPGDRIGFAGIDAASPGALDDIDAAIDLGMAGLTLSPADQGVRPTDDRALAVLEKAAARRLPVMVANPCILSSASVLEFARPGLLDEAARTIPNLTLVLGDLGAAHMDEALLMLGKHERVYAELSGVITRGWSLYTALLAAFERGVAHKLLFASGYPAETPERAIERIYTVNAMRGGASALPGIPRETLKAIVERDALEALGLEAFAPSPSTAARRSEPDRPRVVVRPGVTGRPEPVRR